MPRENGRAREKVISALTARSKFGRMLRHVETEHGSLIIEKRGSPKAVLLSIRDYIRLAAPEPEVLRIIGEESRAHGTDKLSLKQINRIIASARKRKSTQR